MPTPAEPAKPPVVPVAPVSQEAGEFTRQFAPPVDLLVHRRQTLHFYFITELLDPLLRHLHRFVLLDELRQILVPTGRHRRTQAAEQVKRAVVLARRAGEDLLERPVLVRRHARAAWKARVKRGHAPVKAPRRCLLRRRQRGTEHHGVSRTVAHEVLTRLERTGLVTQDVNQRWYAGPLTVDLLREHYEMGWLLEPIARWLHNLVQWDLNFLHFLPWPGLIHDLSTRGRTNALQAAMLVKPMPAVRGRRYTATG